MYVLFVLHGKMWFPYLDRLSVVEHANDASSQFAPRPKKDTISAPVRFLCIDGYSPKPRGSCLSMDRIVLRAQARLGKKAAALIRVPMQVPEMSSDVFSTRSEFRPH